jgi:predicted permease
MRALLFDLRFALRLLRKNPGFTAIAALSLALGIGATSSVFGMVDGLLWRPLPVERPGQLCALFSHDHHADYPHGVSWLDAHDLADLTDVFAGLLVEQPAAVNLAEGGRAERLWGALASADYFDVLGVRPALGRTFTPAEGRPGGPAVVVLSHDLFQSHFGGDLGVVGRTVQLNGHPFVVVGVAPSSFHGHETLWSPALYLPLGAYREVSPQSEGLLSHRNQHEFRAVARLRRGVTLARAQAAVDTRAQQLARSYPDSNRDVTVRVVPLADTRPEPGPAAQAALAAAGIGLGVVGLVLLIACANVANLLLARATARSREIAVRLALGAGRRRVVRQLVTESLVLGLLGGGLGLLLASWVSDVIAGIRLPIDIPIALPVALDGRVLAFTIGVTLLATVLFGLAPALRASRPDLVPMLKGDTPGGGRPVGRGRLVIGQVALSAVLMVVTVLFVRSLGRAEQADPGLTVANRLVLSFDVGLAGYPDARGQAFFRDALERVRRLPGVQGAAVAAPVPLDYWANWNNVSLDAAPRPGDRPDLGVHTSSVTDGYFAAVGTQLLRGREFTPADHEHAPGVAIINETAAHSFWPDRDPLGRTFFFGSDAAHRRRLTVVGVARDGRYRQLGEQPLAYVYVPMAQEYASFATLVVHTAGPPQAFLPQARAAVQALDPQLALFGGKTMAEHMRRALVGPRMAATVVGVLGALALGMAAIGLYGVMAYWVSQRTREIGIRVALGAGELSVRGLVVREGVRLALYGLGCGLPVAFVLARLARSLLFGIAPGDPLTYLVAPLTLLGMAALATWIPARRATRIDPMTALRGE